MAVSVTRGRVYLIQRGEVATNGTVARCIQGPAGLQLPGLAWRPAELAAPEVWDFTRHRPSRPEETRWAHERYRGYLCLSRPPGVGAAR